MNAWIGAGELFVGFGLSAGHFHVDERDLAGTDAAGAPACNHHLLDDIVFGGTDRQVGATNSASSLLNSSSLSQARMMALTAVKPCLTPFSADFARVSGVLGPLDFAPLIRAVSDFNFEVIGVEEEVRSQESGVRIDTGASRDFCERTCDVLFPFDPIFRD